MKEKFVRVAFVVSFAVVFAIGCGGGGGGSSSGGGGGGGNNGEINGNVINGNGIGRVAARGAMAVTIPEDATVEAYELSDSGLTLTPIEGVTGGAIGADGSFTLSNVPTDVENIIIRVEDSSGNGLLESIVPMVETDADGTANVLISPESDLEAEILREIVKDGFTVGIQNVKLKPEEIDVMTIKELIPPEIIADAAYQGNVAGVIDDLVLGCKDAMMEYTEALAGQGAAPNDPTVLEVLRAEKKAKMKKQFLEERADFLGEAITDAEMEQMEDELEQARETAFGKIQLSSGNLSEDAILKAAETARNNKFTKCLAGGAGMTTCPTFTTDIENASFVEGIREEVEKKEMLEGVRERLKEVLPPPMGEAEDTTKPPPPILVMARILNIDPVVMEANRVLAEEAKDALFQALNTPGTDPDTAFSEFKTKMKNLRDNLLTNYAGLSFSLIDTLDDALIAAAETLKAVMENPEKTLAEKEAAIDAFHTAIQSAFEGLKTSISTDFTSLSDDVKKKLFWVIRDVILFTTLHELPPQAFRPPDADGDGFPDMVEADLGANPTMPTTYTSSENLPPPPTDADKDGFPAGVDPDDNNATVTPKLEEVHYCNTDDASVCMYPGDLKDNDGDGAVDEEYPDGRDDDGDSKIDEDIKGFDEKPLPEATVIGKVVYGGSPVENCYVGLFLTPDFANTKPAFGTQFPTNENGEFKIANVAVGDYYVAGFKDVDNNKEPSAGDKFGYYGKDFPYVIKIDTPDAVKVLVDVITLIGTIGQKECPSGQYFDPSTGGCVSGCPSGFTASSATGDCACAYGTVFDTTTRKCVTECPSGAILDEMMSVCVCPMGATLNTTTKACACPTGMTVSSDGKMCVCESSISIMDSTTSVMPRCVETCPETFMLDSEHNMCVCPGGASLNTGTGKCDCPEGTQLKTVSTSAGDSKSFCEMVCPTGTYFDPYKGQCVTGTGGGCPQGMTAVDGICKCDSGMLNILTGTCVTACPTGMVSEGAHCVCPEGTVANRESNTCSCPEGTTMDPTGNCSISGGGGGGTTPVTCPPGSTLDTTLKLCVFTCPADIPAGGACYTGYAPVCGWSGSGAKETFSNDCVACTSGVAKYTHGECPTATTMSKR